MSVAWNAMHTSHRSRRFRSLKNGFLTPWERAIVYSLSSTLPFYVLRWHYIATQYWQVSKYKTVQCGNYEVLPGGRKFVRFM